MVNETPVITEDDDYVYIPEDLFDHLPPAYREAAEARRQQGAAIMQVADDDLRNLIRLANAIPTTSSLSYIFRRLREIEFDLRTESFLENETLTTAFVVTYCRLFASGSRGSGVSRKQLPVHLREVHDDLLEVRNQRYAHMGSHPSIGSSLQIDFDDEGVRVGLQMSLGMYVGGRDEWEELVVFIDGLMHDRLHKLLKRLTDKTGLEWSFPSGAAPNWVSKST